MERQKLSKGSFIKYGMGMMTMSLSCMIPLIYTTMFLTDGLLMSATVAAGAITFFKALDFVLALICGPIVEKSNFKWGKYTSWIKVGQFAMFFGLLANFGDTSSFPVAAQVIIIAIGYLLVQGSMNFVYTALYGIVPLLGGDDMDARSKLTTYGMVFCVAANLISNTTMTQVIMWAQGVFGLAWGYCFAAAIYTLPWFIFAGILVKEMGKYEHQRTKEEIAAATSISVGEMFATVVKNKQLLVATITWVVYYIGFYCGVGISTYYFAYVLGDLGKYSLVQGIGTVGSFIASYVMGTLGMKIGKKKSLVIGMAGMGCVGFLKFLFGQNLTVYIILQLCGNFAMYLFYGFAANYMLDAGEWYLYNTGLDTRAICSACFNLPVKLGSLIGGAISTFSLAAIGYQAGMTFDAAMKTKFMAIFTVPGGCFMILAAVIFAIFYKITDKDAAEYAAANLKRAQEKM